MTTRGADRDLTSSAAPHPSRSVGRLDDLRPDDSESEFVSFTVDAALLRELGERLVGRPHVALAELIKNGYDADATKIDIEFGDNQITVADNGHGMDGETFRSRWMRIGSPHKAEQQLSPRLRRPLTGSKGIGRLAAQFLADEIAVVTVPEGRNRSQTRAFIDWTEAIAEPELTSVTARVVSEPRNAAFPGGRKHGTRITLRGLKQEWDSDALENLARELWPLQPPFKPRAKEQAAFRVRLLTEDEDAQDRFEFQMEAVLELWEARITGRLADGRLDVAVQFFDDTNVTPLDLSVRTQYLRACDFEIRVFSLNRRQPYGIKVEEARGYLNRFGGVHVYDAGFHLPYYGVDEDWLGIEQDHSHRLTTSRLLPRSMQVERGLNFLPTNSRLFGVVNVDTSRERASGPRRAGRQEQLLTVQLTRDRLVDNGAFEELQRIVRTSLDFYALSQARRSQAQKAQQAQAPNTAPERIRRLEDVLEEHRDEIEPRVYAELSTELSATSSAVDMATEVAAAQANLLGALATAGISAIAYQHELGRHLSTLRQLSRQMRAAAKRRDLAAITRLVGEVDDVVEQARAGRDLFTHLLDDEDRLETGRYRARHVLDAVAAQLRFFLRGVAVQNDVDPELRLPEARLADWHALFQNVYTNAVNAMLDSDKRRLSARSGARPWRRFILVQDTGVGVDLDSSATLFEPFERRLDLSSDRRGLGIGGTGLGLTIVRMIAGSTGCEVRFTEPDEGYATALELSWRDR